jgi:GT2 family glycosyltransferase
MSNIEHQHHLPLCSIVIPVFNQLHFTKDCLKTLVEDRQRGQLDVIVIDNASSDGTGAYLAEEAARWKVSPELNATLSVISNATNLGVAPAWNQGCQAARGEYIAILNNDILLTHGWLKNCVWALRHHGLALVSPFAGTEKLDYDLTSYSMRFTQLNHRRLWASYDFCAVVMPRTTYLQMGPFDEKFLVGGYEDTDYVYRLRTAGLSYGITGAAYIHHFGSQTLGEFKKRGDKHAAHNKAYFVKKWGEDPSLFAASWRGKLLKSWRRLWLRFDRMM